MARREGRSTLYAGKRNRKSPRLTLTNLNEDFQPLIITSWLDLKMGMRRGEARRGIRREARKEGFTVL